MDKSSRKEIENIIIEKIIKLKDDILDLKEMTKPIAPENSIGRVSRMDAINNKSINDAALLKREEKLKNLERAKERLNQESFGKCNKCNQAINWERMKIMPESVLCMKCIKEN